MAVAEAPPTLVAVVDSATDARTDDRQQTYKADPLSDRSKLPLPPIYRPKKRYIGSGWVDEGGRGIFLGDHIARAVHFPGTGVFVEFLDRNPIESVFIPQVGTEPYVMKSNKRLNNKTVRIAAQSLAEALDIELDVNSIIAPKLPLPEFFRKLLHIE